jgi:hypothetical protein
MTTAAAKTLTPQDARAAAEARYHSTQSAVDIARAAASRQELDDAEAEAARAIAAAVTGEGDRATADAARKRVEKLRADFEWTQVELQAAETAMSRAADDAARARRGVVAEEYLAAHKTHNDPGAKVNVLLEQLTATLVELVPLVDARNQLHGRLIQEYSHFPADERIQLPPGNPLEAPDASALPTVTVTVPRGAIADAIEAGLTQAAADA